MSVISKFLYICFFLLCAGCGIRLNATYYIPEQQGGLYNIYMYPEYLEFKKNGRCILSIEMNGSDSGNVKHQSLGNYSFSNDTIYVEYIWERATLGRFEMEDQDWMDMEEPYKEAYLLNGAKDSVRVIKPNRYSSRVYQLKTQ